MTTAYDALIAALEHERSCYADWQATKLMRDEQRWQDACALVVEMREHVAALTPPPAQPSQGRQGEDE